MRRCILACLALILMVGAAPAGSQTNDTSILEGSGQAGAFRLGDKIKEFEELEELGDGTYGFDGGAMVLVADGRSISEIRVRSRQFFTQKLIRPRESTLGDVLKVYGDPQRTCTSDGRFVASYGTIEFDTTYEVNGPLRKADLPTLLASEIESVTLRQPRDYTLTFEEGFQSYERGDWEKLAAAMERTICDQPEGELPRKVRTYGMKFRDFVPHFYLGLAWQNLDRCGAALAAWDKSVKTEGIEQLGAKYSQLQEARRACTERVEMARVR